MTKAIRLYDYQNEIKLRLMEAWQSHRSVMVQMPTGTGKTHVLASLVNEELRTKNEELRTKNQRSATEGNANEECIWIIAHRRELVVQIEETVKRYGISREDGRVRVLSIQWLSRHWEDVEGEPSLVIIDEAHHAVAETYKEMWSRWPKARFLGLTATPCRMNRRGFTDLFDTLVTSWGIAEFIEKKYLSVFDYVSVKPGSEEQRLIDSLEKRGADGDYQIKEMNSVLNRHTSIERLYESMERFAGGKKGIVYAISIDHARNIAAYYNKKGVCTKAIDSRTPAAERKRMVEDFKAGNIQVIVNVDIFSEGFDCPDVEFVQMARPTLSLAKYLQQVGRGLRKSEGKEACVLIDNVGLYRVFGLPTVAWDWEAMFRGRMSGKGRNAAQTADGNLLLRQTFRQEVSSASSDRVCDMEVIVSHNSLLSVIGEEKEISFPAARLQGNSRHFVLKSWQEEVSGLWGLCLGRERTTEARYMLVFDIRYDLAAVRFRDNTCGVVDASGKEIWRQGRCLSLRFAKDFFLMFRTQDNRQHYLDLHSLREYRRQPLVKRYGNVELLRVDGICYSRTKVVYVNDRNPDDSCIRHRGCCVTLFDSKVPVPEVSDSEIRTGGESSSAETARSVRPSSSGYRCGYACLLEDDYETYYWVYRWLADGSIVVRDPQERYYHVTEDGKKTYLGRSGQTEERNALSGRQESLAARLEALSEHVVQENRLRQARREAEKRHRLNTSGDAIPFRAGLKWGLKSGDRVIVPPIYRNVRTPVGCYCAVETNYSQWGIIALDGTVLVEPKYPEVRIEANGTALLTSVTGQKRMVRLK